MPLPYDLIIPSARRPHLLGPTIRTLLAHVDRQPERILIHDDICWEGRDRAMQDVLQSIPAEKLVYGEHAPPIRHGPALGWLLDRVQTEYVLYSHDDFETIRPLPISTALDVMHTYHLHHIRFNKRATMDYKGEFRKIEKRFGEHTLTVADHWYFQTSLWRVDQIRPVVRWWMTDGAGCGAFAEHAEVKINQVFNGQWFPLFTPPPTMEFAGEPTRWNDPEYRARFQKTFIWGKVGNGAYIKHLGHAAHDWALPRMRV